MLRDLRGAAAWALVLGAAVVALGFSGYTGRDPDSTAYAGISARLAEMPLSTWLVPQWWGVWNFEGPFREHPIGILVLPALLARAGFPAEQAAYAVGAVASALAVLMVGRVAAIAARPYEATAAVWAALILPVAFVYRVRANQEYPVLILLLAALYATEQSRTRPPWILGVVLASVGLFLVKGIFVIFVPIVCGLWLLTMPAAATARDRVAWGGLVAAGVAVLAAAGAYEWAYRRAAGDSFFRYYIETRLGSNTGLDRGAMPRVADRIANVGWYAARVTWFAVPGSVILLVAGARAGWSRAWSVPAARFAALVAVAYVAVMSLGSNRADRFIFPAYFVVGVTGAIVAMRTWPGVERAARWIDRQQPYGTPVLWLVLFLITFLTGRGLPRIQF